MPITDWLADGRVRPRWPGAGRLRFRPRRRLASWPGCRWRQRPRTSNRRHVALRQQPWESAVYWREGPWL